MENQNMASPYNLHEDRIDWSRISEDDFNRAVEALLVRDYTNEHQVARAFDGKGGDGGIDVGVWRRSDNKILHIFQLKYFPEGFTGGYRAARQPQIRKSFETACKNHEPEAWTLVMPRNPHQNEYAFVIDLPSGKDVNVDILGTAQLDGLLSEHRDIEKAILRNGLLEVLERINSEKAALTRSTDLQERIQGLQTLASDRSPYWDTSFQMTPFGYEEFYTPKHPDAMKHEPIQTRFMISADIENNDLKKSLQKILDFGSFDEVEIPPEAGKLERTGPPWVAPLRNNNDTAFFLKSRISMPNKKEIVTLDLRDQWGYSQGRFEGAVQGRAYGLRGVSVQVPFNNCLTAVIRLETPSDKQFQTKGTFDFKLNIDGALVDDARQGIKMLQSFAPGTSFNVYFNGKSAGLMQINDDREPWLSDDYLLGLLEDLDVVQQKTGLSFVVPDSLSPRERIMLRVARTLLGG